QHRDMINRSEFLSTTALAVGGAAGFAQNLSRPKIGFLGASHSHATEKFKVLQQMSEFDLIGIAEASETLRASFEKLGAKFLARNELIETADVVVVESAVKDHAADGIEALKAGKHVHIEKPP